MSNLLTNTNDLQEVLEALQNKAVGSGGAQATPVISVNSSNGLIIATAGIKASAYQLAFQPAKTITPSSSSQIAVSSGYYTGGDITVAGDSNLIASNIKSGVSIFGVSGTLDSEQSENEDAIISGTIGGSYFNDRVTTIASFAFYSYSRLTTVSFPVCTSIGSSAFYYCDRLKTVSFPVCKTMGSNAFNGCSSLTTASFPACTSINYNAFNDCTSLTAVSFPVCTTIASSAFANCKSLTTVSFPACTSIGAYVFDDCTSLTTVSFPVCTSINYGGFSYCTSLTTVSFPACTSIGTYAFHNCSSLTTVSFPACTSIGSSAFNYCRKLISLYLTGSNLCNLLNSNAFSTTPIGGYSASAGTYGSIYVPASMLTSYQTATNWTYFSSRFVGI